MITQHLIIFLAGLHGFRDWAQLLRRGDGTWYLWIAQHGYSVGQLLGDSNFYSPKSDYVFYPVLPGLIRTISTSGVSVEHAALIVNALSTILTALLVFRFLKVEYSEFVSFAVPAMWVFQPFAIVLVSVLTESLFALFTIGVLLCIQQKREYLAAFLMICVCLSRTTGAAVALSVLIYFAIQVLKKSRSISTFRPSEWTLIVASLLGPLLWPAYVATKLGRADAYFYLQGEQWHSKFDGGITFISKTLESLNFLDSEPTTTRFQIVAIANVTALLLFILLIRTRPHILIWLTTLGIISMAASQAGWFSVKQRFLVPAYFLFIPVALWLEPKPKTVKYGTAATFLLMTTSMTWWISIYYIKWL